MKLFKLLKTAKWWRSRHIDSWAREAKFYWKLSTHYLDLANLSQQDFNFRDFQGTDKTRSNIKFELQGFYVNMEIEWFVMMHDGFSLFFWYCYLNSIDSNWSIDPKCYSGIPFTTKGVGFYICKLAESKVMTNLHSDTQKVHPRILQKTQTFEFPLWKMPSRKVQNFSF